MDGSCHRWRAQLSQQCGQLPQFVRSIARTCCCQNVRGQLPQAVCSIAGHPFFLPRRGCKYQTLSCDRGWDWWRAAGQLDELQTGWNARKNLHNSKRDVAKMAAAAMVTTPTTNVRRVWNQRIYTLLPWRRKLLKRKTLAKQATTCEIYVESETFNVQRST